MQPKTTIKVQSAKILADTITPVSIFLNLREKYKEILLLEASDYRGKENSISYLCVNSIAKIEVKDFEINSVISIDKKQNSSEYKVTEITKQLNEFHKQFDFVLEKQTKVHKNSATIPSSMMFGFSTFNSYKYFDDLPMKPHTDGIPDLRYDLYEFVIEFNHFNNELSVYKNLVVNESTTIEDFLELIELKKLHISNKADNFAVVGDETSSLNEKEHIEVIKKCKEHIAIGDVFQIVPSRQFRQKFKGDDFQLYRALRSVNPSPFLFYYNYNDYKILGSSPELQIKINRNLASIHPIAGTARRTPDVDDRELAEKLLKDPKESAEHVMLVDLARNDLSRHCNNVKVEKFKTIEFYSHVIHIVSKVSGELENNKESLRVYADTFPAGTLSGAPKYKAIELITKYEPVVRSFYGGAIGFMSQSGDIVHAILIRSFLSKENELVYQAGGGIVTDSDVNSEVEEVANKLGALRKAINIANEGGIQ